MEREKQQKKSSRQCTMKNHTNAVYAVSVGEWGGRVAIGIKLTKQINEDIIIHNNGGI